MTTFALLTLELDKCPVGKRLLDKCPVDKCPVYKCPMDKCPVDKCPTTFSCPEHSGRCDNPASTDSPPNPSRPFHHALDLVTGNSSGRLAIGVIFYVICG